MRRLFFWGESDAIEADFVRGGFAVRPWSRSARRLGRLRRVAETGTRAELSGQLKEQSVAHGKRMQEFYAAKKAAKKGKAR